MLQIDFKEKESYRSECTDSWLIPEHAFTLTGTDDMIYCKFFRQMHFSPTVTVMYHKVNANFHLFGPQ